MTSELLILLGLRMFERGTAVLIGGLSIYLGYRLFSQLPALSSSGGEAKLPGMSIVLSQVGPGVFFALFGATIVGLSIQNPIQATFKAPSESSAGEVVSFLGAAPSDTQSTDQDQNAREAQVGRSIKALDGAFESLPQDNSLPQRADAEIALRSAKLALVQSVWRNEWGSFAEFSESVVRNVAGAQADWTEPLKLLAGGSR